MSEYVNIYCIANAFVSRMILLAKCFFYTSFRLQALYVYACKTEGAKIICNTVGRILLFRIVFVITKTLLMQIDNL